MDYFVTTPTNSVRTPKAKLDAIISQKLALGKLSVKYKITPL